MALFGADANRCPKRKYDASLILSRVNVRRKVRDRPPWD